MVFDTYATLAATPRPRATNPAVAVPIELVTTSASAPRQLIVLGEPRVNVLMLNLALDERYPRSANR